MRISRRARPPPRDGDDFRALFEQHLRRALAHLDVRTRTIGAGGPRPPLTWDEGAIELCFVDCGRTFDVNAAWYEILRPAFVPDRTLLVLQDWHTYRQVPPRWYNQMKEFTDSLGPALDLVHELRSGGAATFLYRG